MKSYSRKPASANSKAAGNFASESSKTSAAAVSVTKFGQATFTSVRSKDYENGSKSFVPLKKTLSEDDHLVVKEPEVKLTSKPKVYKFFKSRTSSSQNAVPSENKVSPSNASPKPLVLNSDGVKRITTTIGKGPSTYSKNRNERHSTGNNKSDVKTSESKTSNDRSIKKVTPTKTTQVIIRNSASNVRNATIKPMSTPTNILPASSGVRTSRRLKGIEPESVNSARKLQSLHQDLNQSPTEADASQFSPIRDDFSINHNKITTLIEVAKDEDEIENFETNPERSDTTEDVPEILSEEPKLEKIEVTKSNPIEPEEDIPLSQAASQLVENASQQSFTDSQPLSIDHLKGDNVEENKIAPIRIPKKKIFSNRDRSKVEFNVKSFFSSDMKDEFDIDSNANQIAPVQQSNPEKKNTLDSEEDEQYIKLKRIKKAHQCHDLGETEQFDEDIKYYLSGIVSANPKSMRCLSILGLSQQAMRPEFRMHLRAHDDMPRIIKALMDAPQDSNLAICTATLMFVYNQDRLTMDIDPNALSLMLELLETRSDECDQVEEKHRIKLMALVEEMKNKGHAKYLKLNEITAGKLAMETLLGLTSKRAGDWFKVALREMKGIDFIVNTVLRCAENYSEEGQMVKIDRCMHVLENVTFNNVVNQLYVTEFNERKFISTCIALLQNCKNQIISTNDSKVFLSAFFSILRVLTNLTSESVDGCKAVGSFTDIMELLLDTLFELPTFILSDQRFDLMVIILCLCINLVEFYEQMRQIVMTSDKNMKRLTDFLFRKIDEANQVEQQTDHLLESHETVQMTEAMQDNLLMQMISKSGTHMEHSLLSACVCLLFGCCIQDNDEYMNILKDSLPNKSFDPLIEMLEKLRDFAHLADIMTQKGKDRVQRVLQIFKMYK